MDTAAVPSPGKFLGGPAMVIYAAALKFLFHMLAAANYGLFVDELYFLACGEHLAWGYPDMPPLTAVQAFLARRLFGDSLYAIHLFPSLAGAALVLVVGALTRRLGGGRWAQGIAALGAAIAPGWLAVMAYLSMNSIELVLAASMALTVTRLVQGGHPRLWLVFGLLGGIGLLNKHTILLFCFAWIVSLLAVRERRVLFSGWLVAGGLLAFLIFLPNLIWMWQHGFPHLEVLANVRRDRRDVELSALGFLGQQGLFMMPLIPLILAGLWHFLASEKGRPTRFLGLAFLVALGILLALQARTYYLLPAYSALIAGGSVAFELWAKRPSWAWLRPALPAVVLLTGMMIAPLTMPLLPPEAYIRYERRLGISQPRLETRKTSALPQLFADRFGWPQMAEAVAEAYHEIPQPEREQTAIFAQDYGQAGAVDFYGPRLGLPRAISGHLAYWYWGPRGYTGQSVLVMGDDRKSLERWFEQVEEVGSVGHPYAMASQHWKLHLCRKPKGWRSFAEIWPRIKNWG